MRCRGICGNSGTYFCNYICTFFPHKINLHLKELEHLHKGHSCSSIICLCNSSSLVFVYTNYCRSRIQFLHVQSLEIFHLYSHLNSNEPLLIIAKFFNFFLLNMRGNYSAFFTSFVICSSIFAHGAKNFMLNVMTSVFFSFRFKYITLSFFVPLVCEKNK